MEEKERFEILLEHMAKDIQTVLECHVNLDRKIDRGLEEARIDRESIKQQLSLVAQTLVGKIDKVDQKVEINREEIVKNRKKIEEVDDKLSTSLKKYENHEDRIKVLEVIN